MAIRYTCTGCESVLKIKDEKAGTRGRCPKCKMEFVVPSSADDDGVGTARTATIAFLDDVDMPLELTPEVEDHPDFDPQDVLGAPAAAQTSSARSGPGVTEKKPSVAELMREFEAGKKKEKKRDSEADVNVPRSLPPTEQTVGTATDALSRAYQKKRDSANVPTVSVKDAKAAEQRALFKQFLLKKAVPASAAIILCVWLYIWYMTRDSGPGVPLYPVSGKVVSQTGEVEGLRVMFTPVTSGVDDLRSSAEGLTSADGSFYLVYIEPYRGAPAGKYEIIVFGKSGAPMFLPEGTPVLTVSDSEENKFEIKL